MLQFEVIQQQETVNSRCLLEEGPSLDFIFQVGFFDGLPVVSVTNRDQSRLSDEFLPKLPSYMKHLASNFPDLGFLSRVVHGLMECHPDVPIA